VKGITNYLIHNVQQEYSLKSINNNLFVEAEEDEEESDSSPRT
jgi:hypothetical protein